MPTSTDTAAPRNEHEVFAQLFFSALDDGALLAEIGRGGLTRVVRVNAAAEQLLGLPADKILAQGPGQVLPPDLNPELPMHLGRLKLLEPAKIEVTLRSASGELIPSEATARLVPPASESIALLTLRDVRHRREAERLRSELNTSRAQLAESIEAAHRAFARELHDEVGQTLTALALQLDLVVERCDCGPQGSLSVREARALVDDLVARVRRMTLDLRPPFLEERGLLPALEWLTGRFRASTPVRVRFVHRGLDRRVRSAVEVAAYRIVQEALTNVVRHSGAGGVAVSVATGPEELTVEVVDEGSGFDPCGLDAGGSLGIGGMRERAELLGGTFEMRTGPSGTTIAVRLPITGAS